MVGLEDCRSGCSETGTGTCDGGWYCDNSNGDSFCESESSQQQSIELSLVPKVEAETLFNLSLERQLRDEFLNNNSLGQKHINYYYAISEFVLNSDYNVSTFIKMIEVFPSLNQSINKLLDGDYFETDILITQQLNSDLTSIISDFKLMSDNPDFHYILDDLKSDVDIINNRNKDELILSYQ